MELASVTMEALLWCYGTVSWLVREMTMLQLLLAHSLFFVLVQPLLLALDLF